MAIRLDPETVDAQGLPVVSWEEDRNAFAPEGMGRARVACFIRPDEKTGVLQFVTAGTVRHGTFEEARPWESLRSFEKSSADLTTDGAHVMLANFADTRASVATHLNCAVASPIEVALLHDRLHRVFIARRDELVFERCSGEFVWSEDKSAFKSFVLPKPVELPRWADWLVNASVAAVFGLLGFGVYWLLLR